MYKNSFPWGRITSSPGKSKNSNRFCEKKRKKRKPRVAPTHSIDPDVEFRIYGFRIHEAAAATTSGVFTTGDPLNSKRRPRVQFPVSTIHPGLRPYNNRIRGTVSKVDVESISIEESGGFDGRQAKEQGK